jgi:CarboxypepD_reg-like domain
MCIFGYRIIKTDMKHFAGLFMLLCTALYSNGQPALLGGCITGKKGSTHGITVSIPAIKKNTVTDTAGCFSFAGLQPGKYRLVFSGLQYERLVKEVQLTAAGIQVNVQLAEQDAMMNEVVVHHEGHQ